MKFLYLYLIGLAYCVLFPIILGTHSTIFIGVCGIALGIGGSYLIDRVIQDSKLTLIMNIAFGMTGALTAICWNYL